MPANCLLVEPQGSHQIIIFKINDKIIKLVILGQTKIKSGDTFFLVLSRKIYCFLIMEIMRGYKGI